jgi:hypothetical protein
MTLLTVCAIVMLTTCYDTAATAWSISELIDANSVAPLQHHRNLHHSQMLIVTFSPCRHNVDLVSRCQRMFSQDIGCRLEERSTQPPSVWMCRSLQSYTSANHSFAAPARWWRV